MTEGPGANRHEEFRLDGSDLMDKARQLVDEGNKRRLVVRNEDGKSVFDVPLTVGVVGGIIVFPATVVGVIAALATRHSILVESMAGGDGPAGGSGTTQAPTTPWSSAVSGPGDAAPSSPEPTGDAGVSGETGGPPVLNN